MNDRLASPRLDVRSRVGGRLLRLLNPLTRRLISAGLPTGAPNVLLTTRGRHSGKLRTVPLGMLDFDGRWFVQGTYGQTGWVANLRVDAEAIVTHPGSRRVPVHAVELSPEEAGAVLRGALQRFRRSRVFRALLGPGILLQRGPRLRRRVPGIDRRMEYPYIVGSIHRRDDRGRLCIGGDCGLGASGNSRARARHRGNYLILCI